MDEAERKLQERSARDAETDWDALERQFLHVPKDTDDEPNQPDKARACNELVSVLEVMDSEEVSLVLGITVYPDIMEGRDARTVIEERASELIATILHASCSEETKDHCIMLLDAAAKEQLQFFNC